MLRWGIVILSDDIVRLIPNQGKDPQGDLGTKGRDYTELLGAFTELEERERGVLSAHWRRNTRNVRITKPRS